MNQLRRVNRGQNQALLKKMNLDDESINKLKERGPL
jgi:hypothetical protein